MSQITWIETIKKIAYDMAKTIIGREINYSVFAQPLLIFAPLCNGFTHLLLRFLPCVYASFRAELQQAAK